jgi:hypothetical protein
MSHFPKRKEFEASAAMELYAYLRAKHGDDATQKSIAGLMHVTAPLISKWKSKQGFEEWLEDRVCFYRSDIHALLEQAARRKLIEDFRYWQAMAIKFGYISESESNKIGEHVLAGGTLPKTPEEWATIIKLAREG